MDTTAIEQRLGEIDKEIGNYVKCNQSTILNVISKNTEAKSKINDILIINQEFNAFLPTVHKSLFDNKGKLGAIRNEYTALTFAAENVKNINDICTIPKLMQTCLKSKLYESVYKLYLQLKSMKSESNSQLIEKTFECAHTIYLHLIETCITELSKLESLTTSIKIITLLRSMSVFKNDEIALRLLYLKSVSKLLRSNIRQHCISYQKEQNQCQQVSSEIKIDTMMHIQPQNLMILDMVRKHLLDNLSNYNAIFGRISRIETVGNSEITHTIAYDNILESWLTFEFTNYHNLFQSLVEQTFSSPKKSNPSFQNNSTDNFSPNFVTTLDNYAYKSFQNHCQSLYDSFNKILLEKSTIHCVLTQFSSTLKTCVIQHIPYLTSNISREISHLLHTKQHNVCCLAITTSSNTLENIIKEENYSATLPIILERFILRIDNFLHSIANMDQNNLIKSQQNHIDIGANLEKLPSYFFLQPVCLKQIQELMGETWRAIEQFYDKFDLKLSSTNTLDKDENSAVEYLEFQEMQYLFETMVIPTVLKKFERVFPPQLYRNALGINPLTTTHVNMLPKFSITKSNILMGQAS